MPEELDDDSDLCVAAAAGRIGGAVQGTEHVELEFPCRDGGEIGQAQVAQAEACGLEPERAMNPILLKPNGDGTSQVIVNGTVWKTLPARGYYEHADYLLTHVLAAYADLARRFDFRSR